MMVVDRFYLLLKIYQNVESEIGCCKAVCFDPIFYLEFTKTWKVKFIMG